MAKYPRVCYKHCDIQRAYKKLGYHFDWLDCPYHCEYGDEKLADYDASGCKTISECNSILCSECAFNDDSKDVR